MKPTTPFSAAAVFAAALVLAACGRHEGGAAPAAASPPLPVTAIRAEAKRVPISLEGVGQAEGSREVEIRARVSGIIEKRLYDEGAAVPAGKVLFIIDPAPYELAVQQARAALMQERSRRSLAELEAKRLEPLAAEKAISQRELDQARASAMQAEAAVAAADAKLKQAELDLSYTRITAPIGGVTGRALRSEGSLVTANTDSALLTTLTQVNPVWVRFPLAEGDFNRIRGARQASRVQLLGTDGAIAADNGRLNFAASTVDAKTGAVQLRAEFANPTLKWLPGQFAKVRILAGEQTAFLVPQAAVSQAEQTRMVMTVGPEGKVVPKPVQSSGWFGTDAIIVGGLNEGDMIIVDNLVKVRPGMTVQANVPTPKAAAR